MYGFYPIAFNAYATRLVREETAGVSFAATATLTATIGFLHAGAITLVGTGVFGTSATVQLGVSIQFAGTSAFASSFGTVLFGDVDFIGRSIFSARPQFLLDLFAGDPTERIEYLAQFEVYRRKEARLPVAVSNTVATTVFSTAARAATIQREYVVEIEVYRRKEARKSVAVGNTIASTPFSQLATAPQADRIYAVTLNLYGKRLP